MSTRTVVLAERMALGIKREIRAAESREAWDELMAGALLLGLAFARAGQPHQPQRRARKNASAPTTEGP